MYLKAAVITVLKTAEKDFWKYTAERLLILLKKFRRKNFEERNIAEKTLLNKNQER